MQNVLIVGLGLIGGSVGLALKKWSAANGNALHIIGYDQDMERQNLAKSKGAVDAAVWNLPDAVREADVIILAIPVGAMPQAFDDMAPHMKPGVIVTDTGSTKTDVMKWAESLPEGTQFVGGHPMAGGSGSIEDARADLFTGATWVVCPSPSASETAVTNVLGLVNAVGAESFFAEPAEHDAYVGGISHLPFVVAAALVRTATTAESWRDMRSLASTGFRDTTRVALGSPVMHRDIARTNRDALLRWTDQMIGSLNEFKEILADDSEDGDEKLLDWFKDAQDARARAETPYRRSSELDNESTGASIGSSMGRMLFGGFGKKRDDGKKR